MILNRFILLAPFYTPSLKTKENYVFREVFCYFQGLYNKINGMKWVNRLTLGEVINLEGKLRFYGSCRPKSYWIV